MRAFLIFLLILFSGCRAIQKAEIQNVRSFSRSAKTLSATPGELYQDISDFRSDLRLVESSTLFSTNNVINQLNETIKLKQAFEENARKVNEACNLIGVYADCLLSLVDKDYFKQMKSESGELSVQLSAALEDYNFLFNKKIPANVGHFLGLVVNKIGSIRLKQLQKKYLSEFVDSGSVIINNVCDYFTVEMSQNLELELNSLDTDFDKILKKFYSGIEDYQRTLNNVNPFDYLKNYNPLYLSMKEKLTELHILSKQTIRAMQKIKLAHEKLGTTVKTESVEEILVEIKELYSIVRDLKIGYDKLHKTDK